MALLRSVAARAVCQQQHILLRGIATFEFQRSTKAEVRDLLWSSSGGSDSSTGLGGQQHHAERALHAREGVSLRDAVQSCAARLTFSLAPGTPATYEGALQYSNQARLVMEPRHPYRVVHVNRAWEELCGYRASEVRGMTLSELLEGPHADPAVLQQVRHAAASASRTQVSCINYRKDGSHFLGHLQVSPLYDGAGHISHMLSLVTPALDAAAVFTAPAADPIPAPGAGDQHAGVAAVAAATPAWLRHAEGAKNGRGFGAERAEAPAHLVCHSSLDEPHHDHSGEAQLCA